MGKYFKKEYLKSSKSAVKAIKLNFVMVAIIVIAGAILRINGLTFGLPLRLHPDECVVINPAIRIATDGNLNPKIYHRPNHITIYLNTLSYKSFSVVRCIQSDVCESVEELFDNDQAPFVYLSRLLTALFGTLMILSMYFLGKEAGDKEVGLLAAIITAFFPSFICHSHYATPDIPLAFFISMVALFISKYMKSKKVMFLILGCMFSGLATAEKYPGFLSTSIILFGIVLPNWREKINILKLGSLSFISYLFSIFISAPFLFVDYKEVIDALAIESSPYHLGASGLEWDGNLLYYLGTLQDNMGLLLWGFLFIGICLFVIEFKKYAEMKHYLVVSLFGLIYWILMSKLALHWERWAVPMYIAPILIASVGAYRISMALRTKTFKPAVVLLILTSIPILSLFIRGAVGSINFNIKDTRVVSKQWISENLPRNAKIAADGYTPIKPSGPSSAATKSLEEFKEERVEYIIVSSDMYGRYLKEKNRYPNKVEFYTRLFEEEELVKSFSATSIRLGKNDLEIIYRGIKWLINYSQQKGIYLTGPEIRIYKIS